MTPLPSILALILSYVVGSVPTGLWLGRWLCGVDIRQHGSKNIGATNALRVLGKKMGALALAGDMAKGVVAVLVFARLSPWPHATLLCGLAAIVGHTGSVFLKFRGGKGIATSAGVFASLCPIPTAIAVATFAALVGLTRMVSVGSICAALALAMSVWALSDDWPMRALASAVALWVIVRHRSNIQRILRGTENRF